MRLVLFLVLVAGLGISGCSNELLITEVPFPGCNSVQLFLEDRVRSFASDNITNISIEVGDDCLIISFEAPRCEDNEWALAMVASTEIGETNPPERSVRFLLDNSRGCLDVEQGVSQFDLTPLRVEGDTIVTLNVLGTGQTVTYQY
jgi:hypothetical protein